MSMKVLGVIPARMGSTRFYGKPLALILGKPMIEHVYNQCKKCEKLDDVIIATDSQKIYDVCKSLNTNVIMTSSSHETGLDRIIEVSKNKNQYSHYINIQGDEPLIDKQTINNVINNFMIHSDCQISTAAVPFKSEVDFTNINQVKVLLDKNYKALYFSRSPIPYFRDNSYSIPKNTLKHQGIYGYTQEILKKIQKLKVCDLEKIEGLEQLRFLFNGISIYVAICQKDSIGVDVKEDIIRVEELLKKGTN